jgi:hypothetical protein
MDKHVIFRIVLILIAVFVLYVLVNYYNSKQKIVKAEKFYEDTLQNALPMQNLQSQQTAPQYKQADQQLASASAVGPAEEDQSSSYRPVDFESQKVPSDCFPKDRLVADDLLPKDAANSKWSQVNGAGQGDIRDMNFLTAGALVGIDTVGSSLRNASHDLRSTPPNNISTWPIMNSTIQPDTFRRPLEIASDCGP